MGYRCFEISPCRKPSALLTQVRQYSRADNGSGFEGDWFANNRNV